MEEFDFDARSFYKQHLKHEEEAFTRETGLPVRHEFQHWYSESGRTEVFAVKTASGKDCIGLEDSGSITYFKQVNDNEAVMLLFDEGLMPFFYELYELSDTEFDVFSKYIPALKGGQISAAQGCLYNYCVFVSEGMACFAKQIPFKMGQLFDDAGNARPDDNLILAILDLAGFRLTCCEELLSFGGYTKSDKYEMAFRKGVKVVKSGLKLIDVMDFLDDKD